MVNPRQRPWRLSDRHDPPCLPSRAPLNNATVRFVGNVLTNANHAGA
jgi:hypothetical protein